MNTLDTVRHEIGEATSQSDYTAVNTLWLALVKLANLEDQEKEKLRLEALVERIPVDVIRTIVEADDTDALLSLEPPLETVLSHRHEETKTGICVARYFEAELKTVSLN